LTKKYSLKVELKKENVIFFFNFQILLTKLTEEKNQPPLIKQKPLKDGKNVSNFF